MKQPWTVVVLVVAKVCVLVVDFVAVGVDNYDLVAVKRTLDPCVPVGERN